MSLIDDYIEQLSALLPPGLAIRRETDTDVYKLLTALAEELARVDGRGDDLLRESDPRTTLEMLTDWETQVGLPDPCLAGVDQTVQERRNAVVARLTGRGGQSRQFFIDLAASLGYTVTITEFRPFRAGISTAGDALTNGDWIFAWRVNAPETTITPFRAGQSTAGEPLRAWGNERLECAIERVSPAHTILQFAYG